MPGEPIPRRQWRIQLQDLPIASNLASRQALTPHPHIGMAMAQGIKSTHAAPGLGCLNSIAVDPASVLGLG